MRLGLAFLVLVSHGIKFAGNEDDPLGRLVGPAPLTGTGVDLGTVAVDGFFVLSGFLITRSYLTSASWKRFLWHRALRILPAFWVCLLVTAVIVAPLASLAERGGVSDFPLVGPDSALSYVWHNAALRMNQQSIGGLLDGNVNGSLHTLFFEFLCYLGLTVLGLLGVLSRRPVLVLASVGVCWAAAATDLLTSGALTGGDEEHLGRALLLRFTLMFIVGSAVERYAGHIAAGGAATLAGCAVVVAAFIWVDLYLLLAPFGLALVLLPLGARTGLAKVGARRDLSYGLYVYAWPVQALLAEAGVTSAGLIAYLSTCLLIALVLALLSWNLIESKALAAKSWTPRLHRG